MENKADALNTESELLSTFDYAWNKGSNGTRRHYDVLRKLNTIASDNIQFPKSIRKLLYFSQKPAGIKIKASKLPSKQNNCGTYADEEGHSFFSQIFKFTKSQPRLVLERHGTDEDRTVICGVSLDDGSICRRPPLKGRKRCTQHKGLRISRSNPVKPPVIEEMCTVSEEHKWRSTNGSNSNILGASEYVRNVDFDANACNYSDSSEMSRSGRVQPQVFSKRFTTKPNSDTICGVESGDGTFCSRQPVKGRVRCKEHKGMKIKGIKSKSAEEDKSNVYDAGSKLSTFNEEDFCSAVCGAQTLNGSYCRRPVKGNTNCWRHSKQSSNKGSTNSPCNGWSSGGTSICGAPTHNGSYCKRTVEGGGSCWQH